MLRLSLVMATLLMLALVGCGGATPTPVIPRLSPPTPTPTPVFKPGVYPIDIEDVVAAIVKGSEVEP